MKKITILLLMIFTLKVYSQSPTWLWAKSAVGQGGYDIGRSICSDKNGNVYITGSYESAHFDLTDTVLINADTAGHTSDIFMYKYDQAGNFIWGRTFGNYNYASGNGYDVGYGIYVSDSGFVYLTGYFQSDSVDFGSVRLINPGINGQFYLVKFDSLGNSIWGKNTGGDGSTGVAVSGDSLGNVIVTGEFAGSPSVSFDTITLTNPNPGTSEIFIAKYDPSGNVLWAKRAGGVDQENAADIAIDHSGNSYMTGRYYSLSADFGGTILTTSGSIHINVFIVKYDPFGNVVWARNSLIPGDMVANCIAIDDLGNIIADGYFLSPKMIFGTDTLINTGSASSYIVKYDASGNVVWAKNPSGVDQGSAYGIITDLNNDIIVDGVFGGPSICFGSDTIYNSGGGARNIYVVKYDPSGNVIWTKDAVVSGISSCSGIDITIDQTGSIYTLGNLWGASSATFETTTLTNSYTVAPFVAKLTANSTTGIEGVKYDNIAYIYPNPSNGIFNIIISVPAKNGSIQVYNSLGLLVYDQKITAKENSISLSNQSDGLYFVKVISGNKIIATKKIIKQ